MPIHERHATRPTQWGEALAPVVLGRSRRRPGPRAVCVAVPVGYVVWPLVTGTLNVAALRTQVAVLCGPEMGSLASAAAHGILECSSDTASRVVARDRLAVLNAAVRRCAPWVGQPAGGASVTDPEPL